MTAALRRDYDDDPDRFLSSQKHDHDDVHPYVARRLAAAGARTVLDVGGGNGKLARLLPRLSMRGLLIDLSPTMLALAPEPKARADGARLPVADSSVDAVAQGGARSVGRAAGRRTVPFDRTAEFRRHCLLCGGGGLYKLLVPLSCVA